MSIEDRSRWDKRYTDRTLDVTPAPPDAVVEAGLVDRVPTAGRALDVACGLGAQSVWLAQRGLKVTAIDVSEQAVMRVAEAAQRFGVGGHIDALSIDLDRGLPADLSNFDVIVCQRFRDPLLYPVFVDRLAEGGLLVVTVLSTTGAASPGSFHAPPGELAGAFDIDGLVLLFHAERDGQESIIAERHAAPTRFT